MAIVMSAVWEPVVVNVAPHSALYIDSRFLKKVEGRLWLAPVLQNCHFGLPLAAFSASQTSWDFPCYRRKGGTA